MNDWTIALGALVIVLAITLGALLSRWYFAPVAGPTDIGWCPAEQAEQLHAYRADGSRRCWRCHHTTPAGVPR